MPKLFFNVPLPNDGGLVELQKLLKMTLPEGTTFQEPENFHITLVVMEGGEEEGVKAIPVPSKLPVFGLGANWLQMFSTPNGYAVVAEVMKAPQLVHLQAALFYELEALGIPMVAHSSPGLWQPHITLATAPTFPDLGLSVPNPLHFQVERFVLTAEDYREVARFELRPTGVAEPVTEMTVVSDSLVVWEFKGSYPNVPIFSDVDIQTLTKGDTDPEFVTLPIGRDDVKSDNDRFYSREFVQKIEREVYDKRPTANRGHIDDKDRGSSFPLPSAYWVGTVRVGEFLWGKAYVPPGEDREMLRRLKAAKGKIATSIYGTGQGNYDKQRGAYVIDPSTFNLEHIDFAPPDRAGVPSLAVVPHLTKEMKDGKPMEPQIVPVNRVQVIGEMSVEEVRYIPDAVRLAILQASNESKLVSELAKVTGKEGDALLGLVSELVRERAVIQGERITTAIEKMVAETIMPNAVQLTERVKFARQMVAELVQAKSPQDEAGVKSAVAEIAELAHVKSMVEAATIAEMGPNAGTHAKREIRQGATYLKPKPEAVK